VKNPLSKGGKCSNFDLICGLFMVFN